MKKLSFIIIVLIVSLTGCLKDTPTNDFGTVKPILELPYSGFEYIGQDALNFSSDPQDISFTVNLASVYPMSTDLNYTVKIDDAALASYNATLAPAARYQKFPDSTFKFTKKTGVIKAGKRLDTVHITFYPSKIDPGTNYLLPVSLVDASGVTISGNFGTHYYHVIGNPLAGVYNHDYTRYNRATPTGSIHGSSYSGATSKFIPDDATTIEVESGYVFADRYVITFDNNGGVLSNFKVKLNPDDVITMANGGVTVTKDPVFTIIDPINKIFQIEYQVFNGSNFRYLVDKYYK